MNKWLFAAILCAFPVAAQVTVKPLVSPHWTFVDNSGAPCAGCSLYSYTAGTTTPKPTYTDSTGTSQNTNPVILDTSGSANIWLAIGSYKLILKDAQGNLIWSVDNITTQAYLPLTGGTLTGPLIGTTITASVNGQINVMAPPYSAKGDCITDDHDAIQAAFVASHAYSPWASVYFPNPPGGCYLTSTLNWLGEPLIGQQPTGVNPRSSAAGVAIKGMPGQDILHTPDPNSSSATVKPSWGIYYISFVVDDTVDVSGTTPFQHRFPGRWAADGAMTASSATLTSPNSEFSCSDIGQNIQVNGAGSGGANLVTTVSSVSPCFVTGLPQVVTLAATASTTVSSATVYITPANIPVTQHVGNCAIASDQHDGNSSNWLFANPFWDEDAMFGVSATSTSGNPRNNSCGFFWQGKYQPYALDNRNFYVAGGLVWGVVEALPDTNITSSGYQSGQDYQLWDGGYLGGTYPWISYNGNDFTLTHIQLAGANGPQILQANTAVEDYSVAWYIHAPEFEAATNSGWRIVGRGMRGEGLALCGGGTTYAYLDTVYSTFTQAGCAFGNLTVYGLGNKVDFGSFFLSHTPLDLGAQNSITWQYAANPLKSKQATVRLLAAPTRGTDYASGTLTPDFITSGNAATPYPNSGDLMFWPEDLYGGSTETYGVDSASLTGRYFSVTPGFAIGTNNGGFFHLAGHLLNIGTQVPAGKAILYVNLECSTPAGTSTIAWIANTTTIATGSSFSCGTTYSTTSMIVDMTSYSGQAFGFKVTPSGGATFKIAWAALRPYQGDYNGQQPVLSNAALAAVGGGAAVPTGPATSTSGDCVQFSNTTGQLSDTGSPCGSSTGATIVGTPSAGDIAEFASATSIQTATAAHVNTLIKTLTGCNTATYLYSPQAGQCVAPGTQTICSGQMTFSPGAISQGTVSSATTQNCTGLLTTDNIQLDFSADPTAVTCYAPTTDGTVSLIKYPTADTINVRAEYNGSLASCTPGSVTLNYRVVR